MGTAMRTIMEDRDEVAFRTILMAIAMLLAFLSASAQESMLATGKVKIEGGSLEGARVVVLKEGNEVRTITTDLARFNLKLDLNTHYILSVEKLGYVTKQISFNTAVPASADPQSFTPFEFAVSLFKQYDDVNLVVFDQPVGRVRFDATIGDFDYDTDYTRSIQRQMQEAMDEVARRQKEEEKTAKAEAKRQAAEEREAARVKADAEKEEQRLAAAQAQEPPPPPAPRRQVEEPPPPPVAKRPAPAPEPVVEAPRKPERLPVTRPAEAPIARRLPPTATASTQEVFVERPIQHAAERDDAPDTQREEELIVERDKVVTIVRLTADGRSTEYRKVTHKWGQTFYFKNGDSCSRQIYEVEALGERVAGMTR